MLSHLAQALGVSMEELPGTKPVSETTSPRTARLLKRLRKIEDLPATDQRTVLKLLDALHTARKVERPRRRAAGWAQRPTN